MISGARDREDQAPAFPSRNPVIANHNQSHSWPLRRTQLGALFLAGDDSYDTYDSIHAEDP